jgi:hypothetical protein
MPILHNQINKFWNNPTYANFKKSFFSKKIFTKKDAELFLKIGAYLIEEARKYSEMHIPWAESKKYDILKNPILENIDYSLGAEYLMKGVFLKNGYAVNNVSISGLPQPVRLRSNKGKLSKTDVQTINYIVQHIARIVDFTDFDAKQKLDKETERAKDKGDRIQGITSMGIPHPTARQFLEYIQFKRNHSLHRPFIVSEFNGTTKQLFDLMEYIATKGANSNLKDLAKLIQD